MDSAALFPAYFSNATAPARALVDELLNCDDLLLNFVAANATRAAAQAAQAAQQPKQGGGGGSGGGEGDEGGCGPPAVRLVRPERRLDLSRLSGVGERVLWALRAAGWRTGSRDAAAACASPTGRF